MANKQTEKRIIGMWRIDKSNKVYAICPKCHNKIYGLNIYRIYSQAIPRKDKTDFDYKNIYNDTDYADLYVCPACNEVIATSELVAKAIFDGIFEKEEA